MYADIIKIAAPASAIEGETVIIDVSVKNISTVDQYIALTGIADSTALTWRFVYFLVSPGETVVIWGKFTMPSKKVRVTVWSWHRDGSTWVQDDTGYVDIALAAVPQPEFTGFGITDYSQI